jgi:hypothetical protein
MQCSAGLVGPRNSSGDISQLDRGAAKGQSGTVSRLLRLFLVFGAIIGLLGLEAAFAIGPSFPTALLSTASAMSPDCAEMMKQQAPEKAPCKGLTLDCIAKMGCGISIAFGPSFAEPLEPVAHTVLLGSIPAAVMTSRTLLPDKQPPKLLT